MRVVDDKVGAVDLDKVVVVSKQCREKKIDSHFLDQNSFIKRKRRKRKVRKLDFEVR